MTIEPDDDWLWWAKSNVNTRKGFRRTIIEKRPFRIFQVYCEECEVSLVEATDLTESPFKDEALVLCEIHNHIKSTGHQSINTNIEPSQSLEHINATITI